MLYKGAFTPTDKVSQECSIENTKHII